MKKLFLMMLSAVVLLSTSCTRDLNEVSGTAGDEVTVTFAIATETKAQTRTPGYGAAPQISDGTKADLLIWAVYDGKGNLLAQYGKYAEDTAVAELGDKVIGFGQDWRQVAKPDKNTGVVEGGFPTTVSIRLVRGQEYKIAFWAQSSLCSDYDTKDLTKVEVKYGEMLNNDELRDAFSKVETLTAVENGEREIILRRPLAQINVGVAGYDYEAASKGDCRVVESKIRLNRVARFFNVVTNSVDTAPENLQAIEFEYATIPAYINMKNEAGEQQIPEEKYDLSDKYTGSYYNGLEAYAKYEQNQHAHKGEALLVVDRNQDGDIERYKNEQDEIDSIEAGDGMSPATEQFKYLSMCYVLVPDYNTGTSTYSTTLDDVYVYFKYHNGEMSEKEIHITNVPVQRNWRTNIFGEMLTANIQFVVDIDPIYSGDYNYPEWSRIAEGVSYDPVADEILISNGLGLQWLAGMVNGEYEESGYTASVAEVVKRATKVDKWPADNSFRFKDVTVRLLNDVDFGASDKVAGLNRNWTPIGEGQWFDIMGGQNGKYFDGTFDGGDHTISNLVIETPDISSWNAVGFFATIGWNATVKNLRFIHADVRGHYRAGVVVGLAYGDKTSIVNCYVDDSYVESTPASPNGINGWDRANNVGGIVGQLYSTGKIEDCFVRNTTLRGYRTVAGIVGSLSAEGFYGGTASISRNKVYDVNIIVNQFQPYGTADSAGEYCWGELKKTEAGLFVGDISGGNRVIADNIDTNVKIIVFNVVSNNKTSEDFGREDHEGKYRDSDISNTPLDVFPLLSRKYVDYVHFSSAITGGPSAWKKYETGDKDAVEFDKTSGRVGLYVEDMVVDGDALDDQETVNQDYVLTVVFGDEPKEDECAVYLKGAKAALQNITVRADKYAYTGVCLAPAESATLKLDGVYVYDAIYALADEGNGNGATLDVKNSNFRGSTKLSEGYASVTFTNTKFDTGSGTNVYADGTLTIDTDVTFDGCSFYQGFKFDENSKGTPTFTNCKFFVGYEQSEEDGVTLDGDNYKELLK